jgi:L-asparaginase
VSESNRAVQALGHVVVLGTGGTIAGRAARQDDLSGYVAGQVSADDLVSGIPGLVGTSLEVEQVAQVDSKDMDLAVWQKLVARLMHHLDRPEVAGVVVTHGTDTLEETAHLLQALLRPSKPVVLTCAMRPATALAPDGPQNLSDAVQLARWPGARGVVVLCAGKVHGAQDVTKVHTFDIDAFDSGDAGPLGVFEHGQLRSFRPWPDGHSKEGVGGGSNHLSIAQRFLALTELPRVEVLFSHAAADGAIVRCLLAEETSSSIPPLCGIVVACTGNGSMHRTLESALELAHAKGVRVWRGTRCARGQVFTNTPAFPDTGGLSPVKARLSMMLELIEA